MNREFDCQHGKHPKFVHETKGLTVVDEVLGDSEALIGPHLPLVVVKSLTVDGVFGVVGGGLGGVPVPVGVGEGLQDKTRLEDS